MCWLFGFILMSVFFLFVCGFVEEVEVENEFICGLKVFEVKVIVDFEVCCYFSIVRLVEESKFFFEVDGRLKEIIFEVG